MVKNGIPLKTAKEIWELFPPFASYGFNRSHAACYALISYQTAYLKSRYPVEFATSLLNISGTDIERINFLVSEIKHMGIQVLGPDVNASSQAFTVDGNNIRFGLLAVKNLGANIADDIIHERNHNGPFSDLKDLLTRIQHRDMNKKSVESLIKTGALDSLGVERGQLLENIEEILKFNQASKRLTNSSQNSLFGSTAVFSTLKLNPAKPVDKNLILIWEKELLGMYLTDHPFSAYFAKVKGVVKPLKEVAAIPKSKERYGPRIRLAGIISGVQKILTKKGDPMLFVTLEDLSDNLEVLVFSDTLTKYPLIWQENKAVMVNGRLSWRDDEVKLIADEVKEL